MSKFIQNIAKRSLMVLMLLVLSSSLAAVLGAKSTSAQAGGDGPALCYVNNTVAKQPVHFPVCNYDGLKAGGFDMGTLPNPLPAASCYYFPDDGPGRVVNCEDPQYKNAPEYGSTTPPPVTAKCYTGSRVDGKEVYKKVACTADYQAQIGIELRGECYLIDTVSETQVYKGTTNCNGPVARAAEEAADDELVPTTQPIGTGTVRDVAPGACPNVQTSFFGIPTWYKYLEVGDNCAVKIDFTNNPNQIWLIALAIADMLLRIAGLVAVFFVIYGGYRYITSQFDPEGTKNARDTILNALIGLAVAVLATALVNFVGRTIG